MMVGRKIDIKRNRSSRSDDNNNNNVTINVIVQTLFLCSVVLSFSLKSSSSSSSLLSVVDAFPQQRQLYKLQLEEQRQRYNNKNGILLLSAEKYGRGAGIFPPTNEKSFHLAESFPNGMIPPMASELLSSLTTNDEITTATTLLSSSSTQQTAEQQDSDDNGTMTRSSSSTGSNNSSISIKKAASRGRKRKIIKTAISKILQGAAGAEEEALAHNDGSTIDDIIAAPISKSPIFIAISLVSSGLVHSMDIISVVLMSAYMIILGILANSPTTSINTSSSRTSSIDNSNIQSTPALPSLPLQGHVPSLVSNPLGAIMTHSSIYQMWLRAGTVLGLISPILATTWYVTKHFIVKGDVAKDVLLCNKLAAIACARPLFLLSCQAVTEAISRRTLAPLPLRILIPVAYNTIRLGALWQWTTTPISLGYAGRILAASNFIYWSLNLFAFLIPTATMRYLRAHFFCVEATEVQVRNGGDGHVGLMA